MLALQPELSAFIKGVLIAVGALVPIVNPVGGAPIFLAVTAGASDAAQRALALRVARNVFFLLAATLLVGSYVLLFFGISLPVVKVGGGLVVAASAWRMLNGADEDTGLRSKVADSNMSWSNDELDKKGFYPLTFPLTCGPGSISVALTLGASTTTKGVALVIPIVASIIGAALVALLVLLAYSSAARLLARVGPTGRTVIVRLSAFILLCIGVQIVWDGFAALFAQIA